MREEIKQKDLFDEIFGFQISLMDKKSPLINELSAVDKILDEMPEITRYVYEDIKDKETKMGRRGKVSAEQVLRSAILMKLRKLTYRNLKDEIDTNIIYRRFTRFYAMDIPHYTRLNGLIKRIRPETWEKINESLIGLGIKKKVEKGEKLRLDTTVTQTNISFPVDARLLNDSVRVLDRLMTRIIELPIGVGIKYHDRTRRCKKKAYQIVMAKGKNIEKKRTKYYKELLKAQKDVRGYASFALIFLRTNPSTPANVEIPGLIKELEEFLELANKVYEQAYRRVIKGEKVPADEKLLSIFETHTDIICRGKKGSITEFGHKIQFGIGKSGLVTWYKVLKGNPSDGQDFCSALDYHEEIFEKVPKHLSADRRYYKKEHEEYAKEKGVEKVAIPKPGYLNEARKKLQKVRWYKELLRFRSGIEGCLSTLLRNGMKRCLWKGWLSFKSFIGLNIVTNNLRILAAYLC